VLSPDDQDWIEGLALPPWEDHQLRLLAHGLRTLQTIAARRQGKTPAGATIQSWVMGQPQIATDPGFTQAFVRELVVLGDQLDRLATNRSVTPLSLELADLLAWIEEHRRPSPNLVEPDPGCDHRDRISAPSP
jgi:hypothetical protein